MRDRVPPAHSGLPVEVPQRLHCHAQGALGEVQEEPLGMDLVSEGQITVDGEYGRVQIRINRRGVW